MLLLHNKKLFVILCFALLALIQLTYCAESVQEANKTIKDATTASNNATESNGTQKITSSENATATTNTPEEHNPVFHPIENIQTGSQAEQQQHSESMKIFFILIVLALCIMLTHGLLRLNFHLLPESIAVVFLGAAIGGIVKIMQTAQVGNWLAEEMLSPNMFFLLLLPPIIFEAGYNLHKGNFFQNIGSIMVFAVVGTFISALVVGGGIYLMGVAGIAYNLTLTDSFAFGSLVSAVDPVATIAIFKALNVDPTLNMLVFGESILNDAVSIVLTNTFQDLGAAESDKTKSSAFLFAVGDFFRMMVGSALLGVLIALISSLTMKHMDLRKTPSLELGMMFIFAYVPYGLADSLNLSGIMAILFAAIVMSHYTHNNLSLVTQINMQQTLRTLSFLAETSVFAYLGLAIFSFKHNFQPAFVIWSIILLLVGRGLNIYPLSWILNYFRETKITKRMQFIMWFSGLRGAICYVLSLHLDLDSVEKRHVIITTSLIIVLFTILVLGGSTYPVVKWFAVDKMVRWPSKSMPATEADCFLQIDDKRSYRGLTMSKTEEMGQTIESDHISELTEEEYDDKYLREDLRLRGFAYIDAKYLIPFFTRRITKRELIQNRSEMQRLTNKWYEEVRSRPSPSDDEETEI